MRILLIGANGQLGSELRQAFAGHDLVLATRPAFDLRDPSIEDRIAALAPEVVLHAAAYTKVDDAEGEPEAAMAVNAWGTGAVARGAARAHAKLVYYSTDYVFDGTKAEPYTEDDAVNPLNVYGCSKLIGEQEAMAAGPRTLIIRTSWVYGLHGHNFVQTILKLSAERPELRIVDDQRGSPTYAKDLAFVTVGLLSRGISGPIHVGGEGACSWYEFGQRIVQLAGHRCRVIPISTAESARVAARPIYSALSPSRLHRCGLELPPWQDGLRRFMDTYLAAAGGRAGATATAYDVSRV